MQCGSDPDSDPERHSMSGDRQNYMPSQQEQQEQVGQMGMTKKKKKIEDPYKHIFRKKLSLNQQYHQGRIYFKWSPPYPIQLKYMKHVLQTLDEKKHCLIQAPTGSGKTLCLLNSAFGWLVNSPKSQIVRKVIFTSRSHTQLQQLKKQIEKTCYRPNMVIFAGRNKLCCNEKIDRKEVQDQKMYSQCTKAVQHKKLYNKIKKMTPQQLAQKKITGQYIQEVREKMCQYFQDYPDRKMPAYNTYNQLRGKVITIQDEYEINFQKKQCPYYYPSTVKYFPDLILMPYNYVLNKKILERNQKVIENSILIFDEGHNITDAARNGLTVSITLSEFKNAIDLLKKCSEKIEKKFEDFPDPTQENNGSDQQQILQKQNKDNPKIMLQIEKEKNPKEQNKTEKVKQILQKIEIMKKKIQQIYDKFKKFQQQNLQPDTKNKIGIERGQNDRNIVNTFLQIFFGKSLNQGIQFPVQQIETQISLFREIYFQLTKIYQFIDLYSKQQYKPYYLLKFADKIFQITEIIRKKDLLFNYGLFFQWVKYQKEKNKFQHYLEVKLYCFNPRLMFDHLKKLPMSMIITSGTLSPMDTWQDQTGVQFKQMSVSEDHVILPNQCLTAFMPQYDGKNAFYTTGEHKQNIPFNAKRAMDGIKNICKGTPGGVLVIVPSKDWILQMKKQFPKSNIKKQPFYEQKGNEYMKNIQKFEQIFSTACNTGQGAIIFAKCRGQLTQGIDFKDNMCRSVVIVGYPYPNKSDPYLVGKLDFFDRSKKAGLSSINGEKWMQKQIIRAVNQGIGRVIRHKDDYGMIFLLDVRYKWDKIKKDLSGWALRNTITIKDHDKIQQQCENFFQFHQEREQQNI